MIQSSAFGRLSLLNVSMPCGAIQRVRHRKWTPPTNRHPPNLLKGKPETPTRDNSTRQCGDSVAVRRR